ncbi:hypothetical protein K449DRAFT_388749, partial [Hypoxylon sp. EC38]
MTKLMPAPWSSDSTYMSLKRETDIVHIMSSGNSVFEPEILETLQTQETGLGNYVLYMSMLYTMRMLLDAVFIPIPTISAIPAIDTAHCAADNILSIPMIHRPSASRKAIYFPTAPRSFWCERTASCLRSARAVTSLCQSLMEHPKFAMPPFLGYSLFLAGLIFLNQLQAETEIRRLDDCVERLKTIFSFLGAMKSFFAPAEIWLNTLFEAHSLSPVLEAEASVKDSTTLFSSFMHRFNGMSLPPYCPIGLNGTGGAKETSFDESTPSQLFIRGSIYRNSNRTPINRSQSRFPSNETSMTINNSGGNSTENIPHDYMNALTKVVESLQAAY